MRVVVILVLLAIVAGVIWMRAKRK